MVVEHQTSFTVKRDISKIYDLAINYFPSHGFNLESSRKPNNITFNRKGTILTFDIKKFPMKLYINLSKNEDGSIFADFHYVCQVSAWADHTEYEALNAEVLAFENLALKTLPEE